MRIKGTFRYRLMSLLLMLVLITSVMAGCSSKKKGDNTSGYGAEEKDNEQTTKPKTPPEMKTLPLDTVLLTVDGKEYKISDFMYLIFDKEQSLNESEENQNGLDYWNDIINETTNETGREIALGELMTEVKRYVILKQLAEEAGYKLSDDIKADVDQIVQNVMDTMDPEHKERTGFTKEKLTQMVTDYFFVTTFYDAQVEGQKVNEEEIKKRLNYEDYKQRQAEYLFIETVTDANGDKLEKPIEEVVELVKTGNQLLEKAKAGTDLKTLYASIGGEENADILYDNPVITEGDSGEYTEELYRAIQSLKVGQVYERLVEVENGYYIVRLLDDKVTSLYDDEVSELITQEKQVTYNDELDVILDGHSIIVNEEAWQQIVLGEYAYTLHEEPEQNDSDKFETNDSNSQGDIVLPADAANEDDGSVG